MFLLAIVVVLGPSFAVGPCNDVQGYHVFAVYLQMSLEDKFFEGSIDFSFHLL
jgi:hypothetical protein